MLDSTEYRIILLAYNGFSAKLIQRECRKYDGDEFSLSTIYATLRRVGVRIRDYRNGDSDVAKHVLAKVRSNVSGRKRRAA